jgi:hypothetical protein
MVFARTTLLCGEAKEREIRANSARSSSDNSIWIGVCIFGMPLLSFKPAIRQFFCQCLQLVTYLREAVLSLSQVVS